MSDDVYRQTDDELLVWADCTEAASAYEQQIAPSNGRLRHRRLKACVPAFDRWVGRPIGLGEWQPGPAPDSRAFR